MKGPAYPPLSKAMLGRLSKLGQKKHRDIEGMFLAEGVRTVSELLDGLPDPEMLLAIVLEEGVAGRMGGLERFRGKVFIADAEAFARLAQTTTPQGVCAAFRKQPAGTYSPTSGTSLVVALDDVQDPGNVGTIIRTAAWFGAKAVICGEGTADPYNAKAVRSSAGSIHAVRIFSVSNLFHEMQRLQNAGFMVSAAALEGSDYRTFPEWPVRRVLVIGNEANGIGNELLEMADRLLLIPHAGPSPAVESLNASVSAGILIAALSFV
ncbi:MAG TPA: RNA methyltransferase [Chlorobaculum sp.]|nr:RNA methyltransferase [Chlorobaculum sp.]